MWITSLNSHFTHQEAQHKILKSKIAEPGTPHFLSLNQDIVAGVQKEKCRLKYPHFHKFSADFRSKRYGIGKEKSPHLPEKMCR